MRRTLLLVIGLSLGVLTAAAGQATDAALPGSISPNRPALCSRPRDRSSRRGRRKSDRVVRARPVHRLDLGQMHVPRRLILVKVITLWRYVTLRSE